MDEQQKQLAEWLIRGCDSHDKWLIAVRFGLPTLLQDQAYLLQIVVGEAIQPRVRNHMAANTANADPSTADAMLYIMGELGLKLTVA